MSNTVSPKDLAPQDIERTAAAAVAPVLKIGGAVSGLVGLAYLIGLAYEKAYFATLGAPWAVDLLSYTQIVRAGSVVALFASSFAFAALVDHARTGSDPKSIETWARYTAVVGIVPAVIGLLPNSIVSPRIANICMLAMSAFLTASTGYTLAELIARFRQSQYKWAAHHLQLAFVIQVGLLSTAPVLYGNSKAEFDIEGDNIPTIVGAGLEDGGPWRLVESLDAGLLLVARAPEGAKARYVFRIVPQNARVTVSSTTRRDS